MWKTVHTRFTQRQLRKFSEMFFCCRRFDFTMYLYNQCMLSGVAYPEYGRRILAVASFYKTHYLRVPVTTPMKNGIVVMLQRFGLSFDGNHHSALDDASNLARIVVRMVQDGHRSKMRANMVIYPERSQPAHHAMPKSCLYADL